MGNDGTDYESTSETDFRHAFLVLFFLFTFLISFCWMPRGALVSGPGSYLRLRAGWLGPRDTQFLTRRPLRQPRLLFFCLFSSFFLVCASFALDGKLYGSLGMGKMGIYLALGLSHGDIVMSLFRGRIASAPSLRYVLSCFEEVKLRIRQATDDLGFLEFVLLWFYSSLQIFVGFFFISFFYLLSSLLLLPHSQQMCARLMYHQSSYAGRIYQQPCRRRAPPAC